MRRWRMRDLGLSLVVGAGVTIVVSWSLALHGDPARIDSRGGDAWPARADESWPPRARSVHRYAGTGLRHWHAWGNHDGSHRGDYRMFAARAGWPMPAMESVLRKAGEHEYWGPARGPYDNDGSIEAGLRVPLHWCTPGDGWLSRRLPLRPLVVGFSVNSLLAGAAAMSLLTMWRLHARGARQGVRRPGWRQGARVAVLIIASGWMLNIAVAAGLWCRWQFGPEPLKFHSSRLKEGHAVEWNATVLPSWAAKWPARVPIHWPDVPRWIGWQGERSGIRGFEFTSKGVPGTAYIWMHVSWGPDAFNQDCRMEVTQVGWPFPCLQCEELFQYRPVEKTEEAVAVDEDADAFVLAIQAMGQRRDIQRWGATWNLTLPGATKPQSHYESTPYVPVRPLPLGMAANTMLYSVVVASFLLTAGAVRVWRRQRGGRCVGCGYDMAGLAPGSKCPECGAE